MKRQFDDLQLGSIELFCLAAELGSFTAAAVAAGVTPPAVSRTVQRLEERLGVRLFVRTTRQIRLTDSGKVYFEQCRQALSQLVEAVVARLPEVRARMRARLEDKLAQLKVDVNQDRLEQELVILTQKMDVEEELERLRGHIAEVRETLRNPEPAGRRLDFLMQELNREANTLSSKSQDLETTRAAMDMKVAIDQIREQVQNVE